MIPHPVRAPLDVDDMAVVHETVDEIRGNHLVAEHAAPFLEAVNPNFPGELLRWIF